MIVRALNIKSRKDAKQYFSENVSFDGTRIATTIVNGKNLSVIWLADGDKFCEDWKSARVFESRGSAQALRSRLEQSYQIKFATPVIGNVKYRRAVFEIARMCGFGVNGKRTIRSKYWVSRVTGELL